MSLSLAIAGIGFGVVTAAILAISAVGFTLQFAVTNVLNLAFGSVMSIAGFVAYALNSAGLNIWLALAVAGLTGGLVSWVLNSVVYARFSRHGTKLFGMIIVSIGLALVLDNVLQSIVGTSYFSYRLSQGRSVHLGSIVFTTAQLIIIGLAIIGMLGLHVGLAYTRVGKAMRATAANVQLARACGIKTSRVVNIAWLTSGVFAGIGGVALFIDTTSFSATTATGFLITIIAAAVVGGIGQPYGAMLGALLIGIVSEETAILINPDLRDIAGFAILVLTLLLRPTGIIGSKTAQVYEAR